MNKKRNWRAIFTWTLLGFSVAYALPSAVDMPSWWPFQKTVRGGLDLAGGLELRYTVDWKQAIEDTTRKAAESLQSRIVDALITKDGKNVADVPREMRDTYRKKVTIALEDIDRAKLSLADDATWAAYDELDSPLDAIDSRLEGSDSASDRTIAILLPDKLAQTIRAQVVNETRDNLEKRVGGMGLIDPDVRITGDSDIAVQVPGVDQAQMDVVRSVLGRTAQLTMRFVDNRDSWLSSPDVLAKLEEFKSKNPAAAGMEASGSGWGGVIKAKNKSDLARFVRTLTVPPDHVVGFNYDEVDKNNDHIIDEKYWQAVYLFSKIELTGQHLARARMSYSQEGKPAVYLDMNGEGAELFAEATGAHVGDYLAIMLDEDVQSAPVIKSKIAGGRAEISMGRAGKRAFDEANGLTGVLNQGAFQAPVYKVHDNAVGPSLGADSVEAGGWALLFAFLTNLMFVAIYYRFAGVIAAGVLAFNTLLTFVLLVSFNTSLTLAGVAGIVLTIGNAIDGNIITYERIREEMRAGKTSRIAVDLGFSRAFAAIIDGNLTTAITGFVLMSFTTGPIHNFAVTLLLGIATSVFTSTFVSRLIFNWWLARKPLTLSI